MRNGGIGAGWHDDEEEDELGLLSKDLLKNKLEEVWSIHRERKKEMDQEGY